MAKHFFTHLAEWLVIIGALNWGLTLFNNFNLVSSVFGLLGQTAVTVVYALVGISGLYILLEKIGVVKAK